MLQQARDVKDLQSYVKEELNVREVVLTRDEERFSVLLEARVDWPTLGKKLKKDVQVIRKASPKLTQAQLRQYMQENRMAMERVDLEEGDLNVVRTFGAREPTDPASQPGPKWKASFSEEAIVLLDLAPNTELHGEGLVRDIINRVQKMRKTAGLVPTEVRIQYGITCNPDNIDLDTLIASQQAIIKSSLRGPIEPLPAANLSTQFCILE
ncbi:hypothetical protein KVR01_011555 [Diaporthe batatas]|uniref:uncharacterized protein n=1 Tax=Diaporthe batatas TaxID=748121 RepID=UPI001D03B8A5|nr:uncharacterized protein KVR01_011555 [Diaporthe batatas]KAG8158433.1 hypothetical protein KVR01_011555 [Diaporthe batatas]